MPPPVLTVLRLDLAHPDADAESRDTHRMHARVLDATSGHPEPEGGRILWAQPRRDILVIQAATPARVPPGYATSCATSRARTTWPKGQTIRISLIANPTRRPHRPRIDGVRHDPDKRIALPAEEREAWLLRHLEGAITVTRVAGQDLGHRHGYRRGAKVTHLWHAFAGEGIVADPEALARLQLAGVGPAKGYGCGLLLVQEVA